MRKSRINRRKNKNDITKIASLFLISVVALAGIGVGYSAWIDTITIEGTVNTGYLSYDVIYYSETWVYKWLEDDGIVYLDHEIDPPDPNYVYVAHAEAHDGTGTDYDVIMTFNNAFPCAYLTADFIFHYTGSIPVRINQMSFGYASGYDFTPYLTCKAHPATWDDTNKEWIIDYNTNAGLGYQLHDCDHVWVGVKLHIDVNDNSMQSQTGSFGGTIELIQWNEYEPSVTYYTLTVNADPPEGGMATSGVPLDIGNYVVKQFDSNRSYTIPLGTIVPPVGYIIIARNCDKAEFESFWGVSLAPNVVFINSAGGFPMINGDETYELRDDSDATIDGPTGQPMSSDYTVERIHTYDDGTLPASWNVNPDSSATPCSGANGDGTAGLAINEYSDASGTGNYIYEFVELYYDTPCIYVYEVGMYAPITATENTGYTFIGWTGDGITDPSSMSTTVLMDTDKTVTANFELSDD